MSFSAVCESTALYKIKRISAMLSWENESDGVVIPENIIKQNSLAARVYGTSKGNTSLLTSRQRDALFPDLSRVAILQEVQVRIKLAHAKNIAVTLLVKCEAEQTGDCKQIIISIYTPSVLLRGKGHTCYP